jgi:hypothetical protein
VPLMRQKDRDGESNTWKEQDIEGGKIAIWSPSDTACPAHRKSVKWGEHSPLRCKKSVRSEHRIPYRRGPYIAWGGGSVTRKWSVSLGSISYIL